MIVKQMFWRCLREYYKYQIGHIGGGAKIMPKVKFSGATKNISIGSETRIASKSKICCNNGGKIEIGEHCEINEHVYIMTYGNTIKIGNHCSINPFCVLYGHGGLIIGNKVRIATHVVIIPGNHKFNKVDVPIMEQGTFGKGIVIHDDVWISAGARILDGCIIGQGAVVGAGAVVTKNVEPYTIVAGIPASMIGRRE